MFILFGTRGITYSAGDGDFFCPQCSSDRAYKKKRVRRFFTLYFIPVIPLDLAGEFVECQQCRATYKPEVLDYDPQAQQKEFKAEFERAMKRVMVAMMLADGEVADAEVETITDIYGKITGRQIGESDIRQEISAAQQDGTTVNEYLKGIGPALNNQGKEMVVSAAFYVAAADGKFQEEEKAIIIDIANALEVTPAHLNGLIAQLTKVG